MHIALAETLAPQARRTVVDVIEAFNDAATGRPEPSRPVAILLRDGVGDVQGGAWGVSYYDWLFVDLLYLPEALRGQGWGARIMRAVEREAVRRGCVGVWLDTMDFQAPDFYPRFGFRPFAQITDFTNGHSRIWFSKTTLSGGKVDVGLDIDGDPDQADRDVLLKGLIEFNDAADGPGNHRLLNVLVSETEGGETVGGLIGRTSRGWFFVELLAVPEAARRNGLGRRMMAMAEAEARARGCRGIWLDTFSWQAQPFYERLGFSAIGTLTNFPGPHSRTLMAKRFDLAGASAAA
jgi:GNAT superfamily N-acetyltransferase